LEPLTLHELRHTCAALLIKQGANVLTIQKRLGHKDVRTTLGTYGHLFPEQDEAVVNALDLEFSAAKTAKGQLIKDEESEPLGTQLLPLAISTPRRTE
jgi:hypothetical protein